MLQTQPLQLCLQADVENVLGPAELAKLTDERHTGQPWPNLVTSAIVFASAQVLAAWQVQNTIASLTQPYPPLVVQVTARIAAVECWVQGGKGTALPKYLEALQARCETILVSWVERKRGPGTDPDPDSASLIDEIRPSSPFTREHMKGYW